MARTVRTSIRKLSASAIAHYAREGHAFTAASMGGVPDVTGTGRMDPTEADAYRTAAYMGHVTYTVTSYATPIAWHTEENGWYVTDARYSRTTTSRHMPVVRELAGMR